MDPLGYIVIKIESSAAPELRWNSDLQEELVKMAALFKDRGDLVGVHLCAAVEEEVKRYEEGLAHCAVTYAMYLSMALLRSVGGADHALGHLLLPQIQELLNDARREAAVNDLKRDLGID